MESHVGPLNIVIKWEPENGYLAMLFEAFLTRSNNRNNSNSNNNVIAP